MARAAWHHAGQGPDPVRRRIEGISGLRKEDWLTLLLPDVQPIDAEIAWVAGTSAGLAFDSAVPLEAFDSLVRNFATGGYPPPGGFSAAA